jgi:hypothetical protein
MYEITSRETGETVATVQFGPYRYRINGDHPGVRTVLEGLKSRKQMNRTSLGEVENDESTSLERLQEPSDDFILDRIAVNLNDGYAVVEVE